MGKKVGFIGLGNMGRGMCANLIKAGNDVTVFDTNPEAMKRYEGKAYMAKDTMEVFDRSDFIFLSLPNSKIVESIVEPFIQKGMTGKILIDTSTSYPPSTVGLAARIKESGGGMIDSPMLAGPEESDAGELLAVVGGAKEDYEKAGENSVIILTPDGIRDIQKLGYDITVIYLYSNISTINKRLAVRGDKKEEAERRIKTDISDFKDAESLANRIIYNNFDENIDDVVNSVLFHYRKAYK